MSDKLTLHEASKQSGFGVRKLAFLIRSGLISAEVEGEMLLVTTDELRRYASQPRHVVQKHHASYLKTLGPGLITGASDDDPSGIGPTRLLDLLTDSACRGWRSTCSP